MSEKRLDSRHLRRIAERGIGRRLGYVPDREVTIEPNARGRLITVRTGGNALAVVEALQHRGYRTAGDGLAIQVLAPGAE